jgi:hypothetical protein
MSRLEKSYAALDTLVEQYTELLIKEFEKSEDIKGYSKYLHKLCREDDTGRTDLMRGKAGGFDEVNKLLGIERQIRQLCLKLNEPLPIPIEVVEEYVNKCKGLKSLRTDRARHIEDVQGDHKRLKKRMIQKLRGEPDPRESGQGA